MPCTQDAPLYFVESDDNQPNRKRSRETAYQRHDTANRGTVQSIRADGRYFTNPASMAFPYLISSWFCPKVPVKPARLQSGYNFIRRIPFQPHPRLDRTLRYRDHPIHPHSDKRTTSSSNREYANIFSDFNPITHTLPDVKMRFQVSIQNTNCPLARFYYSRADVPVPQESSPPAPLLQTGWPGV